MEMKFNRKLTGLAFGLSLATTGLSSSDGYDVVELSPFVVTATLRPEDSAKLGVTLVPFTAEALRASGATSLTDLLASESIGYFSQWTPAQSSVVLRGATSNPQGREDGSQVAVLMNGRRTGTANISKLSLGLAQQVEVLKGPASVAYGNNAIGGVVNIIAPDGRGARGLRVSGAAGDWGLREGLVAFGGASGDWDYYLALHASERDDYESGRNSVERPLANTAYKRRGGLANVGYSLANKSRIALLYSNDGTYDAGFRGSAFNIFNFDDRTNESLELSYDNFDSDSAARFKAQLFWVKDSDEFYWGNQIAGSVALDKNLRYNRLKGLKTTVDFEPWSNGSLLIGADATKGELRSVRSQLRNNGVLVDPVRPQDVNADSDNIAVFLDVGHELPDWQSKLRAGLRYDSFRDSVVETGGYPVTVADTAFDYDALTYSLSVTRQASERVGLRAGLSSGFSRPRPTERVGNFLSFAGNPVLPNPDLEPERSLGAEIGLRYGGDAFSLDVALFSNRVDKALYPNRWEVPGSSFTDNSSGIVVEGIEWRGVFDVARKLDRPDLVFELKGNYNYNFTLKNKDAGFQSFYRSDRAWRTYEMQGNFGFRVGKARLWDLSWNSVYHGHFWWETEEGIVGMPPRTVNKYPGFWLSSARARYHLGEAWTLWMGVSNVFDANVSSVFLARNEEPLLSVPSRRNGGVGNSLPGRSFSIGFDFKL